MPVTRVFIDIQVSVRSAGFQWSPLENAIGVVTQIRQKAAIQNKKTAVDQSLADLRLFVESKDTATGSSQFSKTPGWRPTFQMPWWLPLKYGCIKFGGVSGSLVKSPVCSRPKAGAFLTKKWFLDRYKISLGDK
mgnify:CR=1 FL=1